MKKLMIAVAIVCAAAMSHAATANWSAPFTFNTAQTLETVAPVTYSWALIEGATVDAFKDVSFANGELTGATAFSTGAAITVSPMGQEMAGSVANGTADKYYALVIYDANSKLWGISDAVLAVKNPTDASGNTLQDMMFTNEPNTFGMGISSMMANQAVPEPTSGLLLLLGVAGLALRRRRA